LVTSRITGESSTITIRFTGAVTSVCVFCSQLGDAFCCYFLKRSPTK
jgi:hypothetical protein